MLAKPVISVSSASGVLDKPAISISDTFAPATICLLKLFRGSFVNILVLCVCTQALLWYSSVVMIRKVSVYSSAPSVHSESHLFTAPPERQLHYVFSPGDPCRADLAMGGSWVMSSFVHHIQLVTKCQLQTLYYRWWCENLAFKHQVAFAEFSGRKTTIWPIGWSNLIWTLMNMEPHNTVCYTQSLLEYIRFILMSCFLASTF